MTVDAVTLFSRRERSCELRYSLTNLAGLFKPWTKSGAINVARALPHWMNREQIVTPGFLAGVLFALIPSVAVLAWLIWRETPGDLGSKR